MLRRFSSRSSLWRWIPPILWMGLIFFLSSQPTLPRYPNEMVDTILKKTGHVVEYAILAFLFHRVFSKGTDTIRIQPLLISFALSSLYAASDEYHQTFVPGRNGTPVDVVIDALGAVLALSTVYLKAPSPGKSDQKFNYGGQAVIEGVMMRGERNMAVAIREPSGKIVIHSEPLKGRIYTSRIWRLPFVRGLTMLWDALVLGIRSLAFSAQVASEGEVEFSGPMTWGILAISLVLAIGFFFLVPLLLVSLLDRYISSPLAINFIEGVIRLLFLLAYIYAVGFVPDIRRVFAYHGAEHKTINAYEDGAELTPAVVRAYSTAHPRCGTAFLLVVAVIAVLLFALLGRPVMWLRILSRIVLIPVIAGISYELIKFSATHRHNPLVRILILEPSLALQGLTTRQPDDSMLEVAIAALERVLSMDSADEQAEAQD